LSIYRSVIERMGAFRPRAYVVTPVDSPTATDFGLKHLKTDGGHFAHQLKARLQESGDHIPDSRLDRAAWFQQVVLSAHSPSALLLEKPNNFAVFTQAYQDGLLAALGRVGLMRHKGAYSEPRAVSDIVHTYGHLFDKAIGLRRYFDASYIEGYMAATKSLLLSDEDALKLPIVQAFASPSYRKTKRDAHDEVDSPWWIQAPHGAIGSYLEQGDTLGRVPTEWFIDLDERSRTLARRTPGPSRRERLYAAQSQAWTNFTAFRISGWNLTVRAMERIATSLPAGGVCYPVIIGISRRPHSLSCCHSNGNLRYTGLIHDERGASGKCPEL
jgi:hypothetical protein